MKSMMVKVLLGVAAGAVILSVATPPAEAQCPTGPRIFASIGGGAGTNKMRFDPGNSFGQLGSEEGRFWVCTNSNDGNNFVAGDATRRMNTDDLALPYCPTQEPSQSGGGWWQVSQTTLRGIEGVISGTGCIANTCPDTDLCIVVEDYEAAPPGVDAGAYFIGWRTDFTPGPIRQWDLSKFCAPQDSGVNCNVPMERFPVPKVTSATKSGPDRAITTDSDADPSINVYVYTPNAGPASGVIQTYDLMLHTGSSDPGRDRNATGCAPPNPGGQCWTLLAQIPYADAALAGAPVSVPCDNITDDAWIAFGLSFVGGAPGGPVPSTLVGQAIAIECDPNIADPHPKPKSGIRLDDRPGTRTPERSRGGR